MRRKAYVPGPAALFLAAVALQLCGCSSRDRDPSLAQVPVPDSVAYRDSIDGKSLVWICAPDEGELRRHFQQRKLPFRDQLLRPLPGKQGEICHIVYEPTVVSWQAEPDDSPVSELFVNIDTLAYLSGRSNDPGDSLDVVRVMLKEIERPLHITLGLDANHTPELYAKAMERVFPNSIHQIRYQHLAGPNAAVMDPWVQDMLIAGKAQGQEKILVTRRAFEGNAEMGEPLKPMLDSYRESRYFRSKLSLEGGDLTVMLDPRDPKRTILFHGQSAKPYWGESLTEAEYAFVVQTELGADETVDVSGLAPHVDYALALIPDEKAALIGKPVCDSAELAREAVEALMQSAGPAARAALQQLDRMVKTEWRPSEREELLGAVERSKEAMRQLRSNSHRELTSRVQAFVASNCPQQPLECLAAEHLDRMLELHGDLLREWVEAGAELQVSRLMGDRLLGIVEHQIRGCDASLAEKLDALVVRVQGLGYRVVRVPWLIGSEGVASWPGISYVNAALVDRKLFVPRFGLGALEDGWFRELDAALPNHRVVPIWARLLLLRNGGIHCAMAFGRHMAQASTN